MLVFLSRVIPIIVASSLLFATPLGPPSMETLVLAPFVLSGREQLASGVYLEAGSMTTKSGNQAVYIVDIDPLDPMISLEAALSNDRVTDRERTSRIAARKSRRGHRVVAAVNADLCERWFSFVPRGSHIQNGELMVAGLGQSVMFGIGPNRRPMLGTVTITAIVSTSSGLTHNIARVNQWRHHNELVLYTPRFDSSTHTNADGTEVILSGVDRPITPSGTFKARVNQIRIGKGKTPISPGTVVLSAVGSAAKFLNSLVSGEIITLKTTITPGWEEVTQAVSGREWILRDAKTYIWPQVFNADIIDPHSAIGIRADGRVVIAIVDGRQANYSSGVNIVELAQLMKSLGVVQAINLDGGGSTTLAVRHQGDIGVSIVNSPSDRIERSVTNNLLVISGEVF